MVHTSMDLSNSIANALLVVVVAAELSPEGYTKEKSKSRNMAQEA